jgi:hypothetical protein
MKAMMVASCLRTRCRDIGGLGAAGEMDQVRHSADRHLGGFPSEGALLLLGMESGLLSLHFRDELFDSFMHQLIVYPGNQMPVVLDLLVEFLALVAHGQSAQKQAIGSQCGKSSWPILFNCVQNELGHF